MKRPTLYCLLSAAISLAAAPAFAQGRAGDYPSRPIRLIVPQAAGAGSDITARAIIQKIPETWGHPLVVDNRAGANGIIGMELAAKARPDGYTLLYANTSSLTINPSVYKSLPYDTLRDYAAVTQTVTNTLVLVVHPGLPARSVKELMALARSKPGQINYGSAGVGNQTHLTAEMFLVETGLKMLHVPYKGATPAITELLAGQVGVMFTPSAPVTPHIQSGKLRLLATCGEKRARAYPDAPTLVESGLPGVVASGWGGVLAPAGTPPDIILKVQREFARQLLLPGMQEVMETQGSETVGSTPQAFDALLKTELKKWDRIVRAANLHHSN